MFTDGTAAREHHPYASAAGGALNATAGRLLRRTTNDRAELFVKWQCKFKLICTSGAIPNMLRMVSAYFFCMGLYQVSADWWFGLVVWSFGNLAVSEKRLFFIKNI